MKEWHKLPRLWILYINILTHRSYPWESRSVFQNYQTLNSAGNGCNFTHKHVCTYADILNNSNNLLYDYKFCKSIYQKYIYHNCVYNINQICQEHIFIPKPLKCQFMYTNYSLRLVSNIYRTINKFLPNTIIDFTWLRLLQSYLVLIITRRNRNNLFHLYYGSYLPKFAWVINFRWCFFTSQMHLLNA